MKIMATTLINSNQSEIKIQKNVQAFGYKPVPYNYSFHPQKANIEPSEKILHLIQASKAIIVTGGVTALVVVGEVVSSIVKLIQ